MKKGENWKMDQLLNLLIRYSCVTNIPLSLHNGTIELDKFFIASYEKGLISDETWSQINDILNV